MRELENENIDEIGENGENMKFENLLIDKFFKVPKGSEYYCFILMISAYIYLNDIGFEACACILSWGGV